MKQLRVWIGLLMVGLAALSPKTSADMAVLEPIQVAVCPSDSTGMNGIAALFDISALDSLGSLDVEDAVLLWEFTGLATSNLYEFTLFEAPNAWTTESIQTGQTQLVLGTPVDSWLVGPQTNEDNQGVIARLGLKRLADEWVKGTKVNNGMVITTSDVPVATLASQASAMRLQIWYSRSDHQ